MPNYTEEKRLHVTITHLGSKEVREETLIFRDGEEVGRRNHRYVVASDSDVPADVEAHISARKGRQPPRPQIDR